MNVFDIFTPDWIRTRPFWPVSFKFPPKLAPSSSSSELVVCFALQLHLSAFFASQKNLTYLCITTHFSKLDCFVKGKIVYWTSIKVGSWFGIVEQNVPPPYFNNSPSWYFFFLCHIWIQVVLRNQKCWLECDHRSRAVLNVSNGFFFTSSLETQNCPKMKSSSENNHP